MTKMDGGIIALVVAAGFLGCGGGEAAESYTLEEFTIAASEQRCKALTECGIYEKAEDCANFTYRFALLSNYLELTLAIDESRVVFDGELAFACAEAIGTPTCTRGAEVEVPPECDQVFIGSTELDGECLIHQECGTGLDCNPLQFPESQAFPSCFRGRCRPSELPTLAQACDGECAEGLYCDLQTGGCLEAIGAGETCNSGSNAARCVDGHGCVNETCEPLPRTGEECTFRNSCVTINDRCPFDAPPNSPATCQPGKANGEACGLAECVWSSRCVDGICQKAGDIGDVCSNENWCQFPLQCTTNGCALPGEPTELCPTT